MTQYSSQSEAHDAFQRLQNRVDVPRILRASYAELEREFLTNKPYLEIAQHYGVSRQRIQQIYSKYFQPFMDTPRQRVNARVAIAQAERLAQGFQRTVKKTSKLAALKTVLESQGLNLELIPVRDYGGSTFTVKVGEHVCRVQIARRKSTTSPKSKRLYWRFNLTYKILELHEFVIFVCGADGDEDFFIVPSQLLIDNFSWRNGRCNICIESKNLPPYNNQISRIQWRDYNKAWSQLA